MNVNICYLIIIISYYFLLFSHADLAKLRSRPDKFRVHLFASGRPAQKQYKTILATRGASMLGTKGGYKDQLSVPTQGQGHTKNRSLQLNVTPVVPGPTLNTRGGGGGGGGWGGAGNNYNNNVHNINMQQIEEETNFGDNDDNDWQEYQNGNDEYTEYANQYAPSTYWYNAKTGETSLSPPVRNTAPTNNTTNKRSPPAPPANSRVMVTQYFSGVSAAEAGDIGADIQFGRPDFSKMFGELEKENPPNGGFSYPSCGVFMCGPVAFMDSVQSAADEFGFHTHRETFGF